MICHLKLIVISDYLIVRFASLEYATVKSVLERPQSATRDHLSWKTTYSWQKVPHYNASELVTKPPALTDHMFVNGAVFQYRFYCSIRQGTCILHGSFSCTYQSWQGSVAIGKRCASWIYMGRILGWYYCLGHSWWWRCGYLRTCRSKVIVYIIKACNVLAGKPDFAFCYM